MGSRTTRSAVVLVTAAAGLAMMSPVAAQAASHPAAAKKPVNLIRDSGADRAKGNSEGGRVKVPDWKPAKGSMFTAVPYGAPEFAGKHSPGPKHRGKNFFAGGPSGNTSGATQVDSLSADHRLISSGKAVFKLAAYLGGYSSQTDHATLTITWENSSGKTLGHTTLGPVSAAQRKNVTGLLHRSKAGSVPKGATQVVVKLHMVRKVGEYVDGYADNLYLAISKKS